MLLWAHDTDCNQILRKLTKFLGELCGQKSPYKPGLLKKNSESVQDVEGCVGVCILKTGSRLRRLLCHQEGHIPPWPLQKRLRRMTDSHSVKNVNFGVTSRGRTKGHSLPPGQGDLTTLMEGLSELLGI